MKKNIKSGFSLAEVLISVGIISVIATLGLPIAQKNIDQAYNKYVYTGAEALSLAIADAEIRGRAGDLNQLENHIASLLNTQVDNNKITAANNIIYELEFLGSNFDGTVSVYRIAMTTPKRKGDDRDPYYFFYTNANANYPKLFPTNGLEDRMDLIKYYIQDPSQNNNPTNYFSFRQAACNKLGGSQRVLEIVLLVCQEAPNPAPGILRMARP